jgi:hypothetical protein
MADEIKPENSAQGATPGSARPSGGIMDVQRPKPTDTGPLNQPAEPEPGTSFTPASGENPASVPPETPQPSNDPIAPPENESIAKPPESEPVDAPAHTPDEHTDETHPLLAAHATKKHSPVVPIVVAGIIALALIAVTVFAFLKTKETTTPDGDDHTSPTHQETSSAATTQDIDDANKEIDQTLTAVDEAKDFPEADLSDQSLGL